MATEQNKMESYRNGQSTQRIGFPWTSYAARERPRMRPIMLLGFHHPHMNHLRHSILLSSETDQAVFSQFPVHPSTAQYNAEAEPKTRAPADTVDNIIGTVTSFSLTRAAVLGLRRLHIMVVGNFTTECPNIVCLFAAQQLIRKSLWAVELLLVEEVITVKTWRDETVWSILWPTTKLHRQVVIWVDLWRTTTSWHASEKCQKEIQNIRSCHDFP